MSSLGIMRHEENNDKDWIDDFVDGLLLIWFWHEQARAH